MEPLLYTFFFSSKRLFFHQFFLTCYIHLNYYIEQHPSYLSFLICHVYKTNLLRKPIDWKQAIFSRAFCESLVMNQEPLVNHFKLENLVIRKCVCSPTFNFFHILVTLKPQFIWKSLLRNISHLVAMNLIYSLLYDQESAVPWNIPKESFPIFLSLSVNNQ